MNHYFYESRQVCAPRHQHLGLWWKFSKFGSPVRTNHRDRAVIGPHENLATLADVPFEGQRPSDLGVEFSLAESPDLAGMSEKQKRKIRTG